MNTRTRFRWVTVGILLSGLMIAASASAQEAIQAIRVPDQGSLANPEAAFWGGAKPVAVTMLPQMVATPIHINASVKTLYARAAHNGQWLAILIQWIDPTKNDRIMSDEFGDQVAVAMPVHYKPEALPSPMMGNPGGRIIIRQWRAAFQHDIDKGELEIRDLYPNALVDVYPDQVLRAIDARPYMGALGVDNPISRPKQSPVIEQMAEGWGTLTVTPDQHADGKGVWKDGYWHVVITFPLFGTGETQSHVEPGGESVVTFAVWNGGNSEVGSRKAWSAWTLLKLAK